MVREGKCHVKCQMFDVCKLKGCLDPVRAVPNLGGSCLLRGPHDAEWVRYVSLYVSILNLGPEELGVCPVKLKSREK